MLEEFLSVRRHLAEAAFLRDHVVSGAQKPAPFAPAGLLRWQGSQRFSMDMDFLLVYDARMGTRLLPHREHAVREITGRAGSVAQRDPGTGGPVPGSAVRRPAGGGETLSTP